MVVATDNSPQKVRPNDGGERRRTSNRPMRILAEQEPELITAPSSSEDGQDPKAWEQRLEPTKVNHVR